MISTPSCDHCGLPVPARLAHPGASLQFCCAGCRIVHGALHAEGLAQFYRLQDAVDRQQARVSGRSYGELDEPIFHERYCQASADGRTLSVELYLEGARCTACVWLVERLPRLVPGVVEARLDLGRSRACVVWEPDRVSLSHIARRLDGFGYPAHPFSESDRSRLRRREEQRLLIRLGVAGACAGNVMLIAFALYSGQSSGMAREYETLFRWASLLVSTPALVFSGGVFFRGAWGALRAGTLHMDLPIALGVAVGFGWGAVNTLRGAGEVYFDSVCALIFLLLFGRYLQQRQQRGAADAAELLFALTPSSARLLEGGEVREVPLEALLRGALVEVRAGDSIPADGEIVSGRSSLDASLLSGESRPQGVGPGDNVFAGSVNLGARLVVRVDATGEQTRVGRLLRQVEEHARRRAPVVLMADRLSGWFVGGILVLATLTALVWSAAGVERALENAVALLIVTCPCALGLATPLAVSVAIGRAARAGILIKGGDVLERLGRRGRVLLDKTGTLTEGRVTLRRWLGDPTGVSLAAALERHSAHPLARALVEFAREKGHPSDPAQQAIPEPMDVRETPGAGIAGVFSGEVVRIGSVPWIRAAVADWPDWVARGVDEMTRAALTPVVVCRAAEVTAVAGFGDPIRADARATLDRLRRRGWRLAILSGDHPEVVRAVARELDVPESDCEGGATPERKLERVQRELTGGPVVMVGDGVNDAAALAAATCGIAVHGGAEASLAAADAYVSRPGLSGVAELFEGAQAAIRLIKRNLAFSLAYNLVGACLAVSGLIGPLVAALLMPASSLTVVTSSFRSTTFRLSEAAVDEEH